jgi:hypothetical protein
MATGAEALYDVIMKTVDEEVREELDFLVSYDRVKQGFGISSICQT